MNQCAEQLRDVAGRLSTASRKFIELADDLEGGTRDIKSVRWDIEDLADQLSKSGHRNVAQLLRGLAWDMLNEEARA